MCLQTKSRQAHCQTSLNFQYIYFWVLPHIKIIVIAMVKAQEETLIVKILYYLCQARYFWGYYVKKN
jgi:hypothetical protein